MAIYVFWTDLTDAAVELLGYSYRDPTQLTPTSNTPFLRRKLPWQHPYFNQLWCKSIDRVQGMRFEGKNSIGGDDKFDPAMGGAGKGFNPNTGPWSDYKIAMLTLSFWRPPYFVRSDSDILDANGEPQEWLRYTDKHWQVNTQILSREGSTFTYATIPDPSAAGVFLQPGGTVSVNPLQFQGSVGQKVSHLKLTRKWYQVPERGIFNTIPPNAESQPPIGTPDNLIYMRTSTTNPVTGYVQNPGMPPSKNYPILCCVNSPLGGGVNDSTEANKFFGFPMGTLLYESFELVPRELQLPPYLMQIPGFANNEAISQQQYDVVFHFDYFDPPRAAGVASNSKPVAYPGWSATVKYQPGALVSSGGSNYLCILASTNNVPPNATYWSTSASTGAVVSQAYRGHNTMPWSRDGLWYMVRSSGNVNSSSPGACTTPLQYADFTDIFKLI